MTQKKELLQAAKKHLRSRIEALEKNIKNQDKARQEAPSAKTSWSDTTRSQKEHLLEELHKLRSALQKTAGLLDKIDLSLKNNVEPGALVKLRENNKDFFYLIAPKGASGEIAKIENRSVELLSMATPLGKQLAGHKQGEVVKVKVPAGTRSLKILEVK